MRHWDFGHYALSSCVAIALLAGCGISQPPIAAPIHVNSAESRELQYHTSWLSAAGKKDALLCASSDNPSGSVVDVLSYPEGKLVGTLTGFGGVGNICSDPQGNVYIPDAGNARIVVYAHGGTAPIAILSDPGYLPVDCSFDAMSGNLAVTNYFADPGGGYGNVAIYTNARGTPTFYSDPIMYEYESCAYDNQGNLFVNSPTGSLFFAELPRGSSTFINISLPFSAISDVGWDGTYIAVASTHGIGSGSSIYRLSFTGSKAHVEGTVPINWGNKKVLLGSFWIGGHKLVGGFAHSIGYWRYPNARSPKVPVRHYGLIVGVTVSFPTN